MNYKQPESPYVLNFWKRFDDDMKECFEERAGILEYDAGMYRKEAEEKALREVLKKFKGGYEE